jgi:preprotein translocase subunit SecF
VDFFRGKNWDIIGKTKLWFTISGITIALGIAALAIHGLNYGIDFTGGSLLRYQFAAPLAASDADVAGVSAQVRQVLDGLDLGSSEVQVVSDDAGQMRQLYLRTPPVANDEEAAQRSQAVMAGLREAFADKGEIVDLGRETVGPVVGEELRNKAILAFGLGCILIMIYITIRYEFRFAVAAIIGLLHDVLVVLGCMALFHVELNSAFVAALLTVLGFSNHDTVVIMDRIRENMRIKRQARFADTVNTSLLETLARSVNMIVTVLFTIVALLLFGGEAIRGFSLALLFGISTGCYSSIFTAAPIVVLLEGRAARAKAAAVAAARGGRGTMQRARPSAGPRATEAADGAEAVEGTGRAGRSAIERLQREEVKARAQQADAVQEEKREDRRERRKREKERLAKKSGGPKKRF